VQSGLVSWLMAGALTLGVPASKVEFPNIMLAI